MRVRIASRGAPGSRLLDPTVLSRIGDLELVARTVVEGFMSGLHRSPFLGLSLEFAEHRAYEPGDDIRKIDWRVFGRTDRFYVKEYEAETNANVFFALDVSGSMSYGSGEVTKLDYARYLAACLAYLSADQRDRVGAASFHDRVVEHVPPSVRHRRLVLALLDRAEAGAPGDLVAPLRQIGESLRRRGIVVLISDLYAEPRIVLDAVAALRGKGHDVIVFQVLDPAELRFPFETPSSFEDLETGERVPVTPDEMADEYRRLIEGHTSGMGRLLTERGIDYALFDTSRPLDGALFRYLSLRARRLKRKS
ncbi:MAG: DUF58 domain-containing protein [Gemmatimonadota bacterium]